MVYGGMEHDSSMADQLFIKIVLLVLKGFLFFALYSFSCIAKQVMTFRQLPL